jgi:hypothetical protein
VHIDLRPTTPSDAAALSAFLGRIFQVPAEDPFLAEQHMAWKYWSDRADWRGSRGCTVRHAGTIVGHAAAWPVRLRVPGREIPAVHVIDWAADPRFPGAGVWLMREITGRTHTAIATGGSAITRRLLPVIGFRPHGEICWFARPVRPLGQALTSPRRDWKLPARLARNSWWSVVPPRSMPRGWSAEPFDPRDVPEDLWPQPTAETAVTARDAAFYQFVAGSPAAAHVLFGLRRGSELAGYFCLAFAPHVARIADLWLPSKSSDDWCDAYRTAAAVASRRRDVYELSAWASTTLGKESLGRAGFRLRERLPISFYGDPAILDGRELHVQMLDCDASFATDENARYLT